MERYAILADIYRRELVIEKSRFIATLAPVSSEEEARGLVASLSREFPDATHHCWAYLIGPPGSMSRVGMSDAGEPGGTAGRPMLNALVYGGVGDVAAVVTRYFGGKKLGTGGLSRAYGGAVSGALAEAPRVEKVDLQAVTLTMGYPEKEKVELLYRRFDVRIESEEFGETVIHHLQLPTDQISEFEKGVAEASSGRVTVKIDP